MGPSRSSSSQSLFDQKLDRAVQVTYFLGAIVPLLVLGVVAMRYALPALEGMPYERGALLSVVLCVGVLTLVAYLALRRL